MDTIPKTPVLQAPLKDVYPYAVYFLNTLGGSSYLIRRVSQVRMLTQYYSILILDQANQRNLNKLGLDIRPPLEALIGDLKGTANLTRKEEYIETLKSQEHQEEILSLSPRQDFPAAGRAFCEL